MSSLQATHFPPKSLATMNRFHPANFSLHNQDLTDIMFLIGESDNHTARAIYDVAYAGHIHSLDEKQLDETRRYHYLSFPKKEESPFLSDAPLFESLPNIHQIKYALRTDFQKIDKGAVDDDEMTDIEDADVDMDDAKDPNADIEMIDDPDTEDSFDEIPDTKKSHYYFEPSLGSSMHDARAARELLRNIDNPAYRQPGSILEMYSATLDSIPSKRASLNAEGMLYRTRLEFDVSPAEDFSGIVYHEDYYMSTLLTGQKIWIVYPPLYGNRGKVLRNYEEVVACKAPLDAFTRLEHGIAIIQGPGQTVAIPPLWMFTQFCTQTSTSCAYKIETARQLHKRFKDGNAKLFMALTKIWPPYEEQQQAELLRYVTNLVGYLDRILTDSIRGFNTTSVIIDICRDYAGLFRSFARVLAVVQDKVQARQIEQDFLQTWLKFLEKKFKKKPECRICHMPAADLPVDCSTIARLERHFVEVHCAGDQ
jgi:hypothetical protein